MRCVLRPVRGVAVVVAVVRTPASLRSFGRVSSAGVSVGCGSERKTVPCGVVAYCRARHTLSRGVQLAVTLRPADVRVLLCLDPQGCLTMRGQRAVTTDVQPYLR